MTRLRPYQQDIVQSVCAELRDGGLGQVHMACGSGKTIVAQRAAERLVPDGGTAVVLVPSLALAAQTLRAWGRVHQRRFEALAVCSDDTVADAAVHPGDLGVPVTTDAGEIETRLHRTPVAAGFRLVVCTYASAARLADAVKASAVPVDLVVFDEAHHMTGRPDFTTRQIMTSGGLPARRKLFMTATPRYDFRITKSASLLSMDDAEVFGPVLAKYPFARGIAEGYLDDYRIVVVGVRDSEARKLLVDERVEYTDGPGVPSLQTAVAQVALARARERFGVRRVVTFHHRVDAAAEFAHTLPATVERVAGPEVRDGLYAGYVHGEMDHRRRELVLDQLRNRDGWTVISNARCLGEGVDIPAVDAVLFAHPKKSAVDITQAVGRALRRDPQASGTATVIVPLVVPEQDGELVDLEPGEFATLWEVVRALRAHDESLGIKLDEQRSHLSTTNPQLPDKITVMLPPGVSDRILTEVSLLLVRQTTSVWWDGYGHATRYHEQHGHLNVPADHQTSDGFALGRWVTNRRHERRRGWLSTDRITKLDAIDMTWDLKGEMWQTMLAAAARYYEQHGHLNVPCPHVTSDGYNLGHWIARQRVQNRSGKLSPEQIAQLDAVAMVWDPEEVRFNDSLAALVQYRAEHGHLRVPKSYVTADGHPLGEWLGTQRQRRRKGRMSPEQVTALERLGMDWRVDREEESWNRGIAAASRYHAEHGDLNVPRSYRTTDGYGLGSWLNVQRSKYNEGKLTSEQVSVLEALDIAWDPLKARWQRMYAEAKAYHAEHGHLQVPKSHVTADGHPLGEWLGTQRQRRRKGRMSPEQVTALENLGIAWR